LWHWASNATLKRQVPEGYRATMRAGVREDDAGVKHCWGDAAAFFSIALSFAARNLERLHSSGDDFSDWLIFPPSNIWPGQGLHSAFRR